ISDDDRTTVLDAILKPTDNTNIKTTGAQAYDVAARLELDAVLTSTSSGAIHFNDTLDSFDATPRALAVNTAGETRFGDGVGNDWVGISFALASLTTDGGGTTVFNVLGSTTANPSVK